MAPKTRREFIALVGGAASWPLSALAQQAKTPTVGVLVIGNISPEQFWREFRQGLRDLGYVEGQNIRFEFRSAEGLPVEVLAEIARVKAEFAVPFEEFTAEMAAEMAQQKARMNAHWA